jgi:hypothetical protein
MMRGIMKAKADAAVLMDTPALEAILPSVSLPRAISTWLALAVGAPPLSHEDTLSPIPVLRKRSNRPFNPPPCSFMKKRREESRVVTLLLLKPNLLPASFRTASSAPIVLSNLASRRDLQP